MQRPAALVGFSFLLTLIAAVVLGFMPTVAIGVVCLLGAVVLLALRRIPHRRAVAAVLLSAALACGCFAAKSWTQARPVEALDGMAAAVTGTIVEEPEYKNGSYSYEIRADETSLGGAPKRFKFLLVSHKKLDADAFDTLRANVVFYRQPGGGLDSYAPRGIFIRAYLDASQPAPEILRPEHRPIYYHAITIRRFVRDMANELLARDTGALVNGIVLGDLSEMDPATVEAFRVCGISHIVAVSGMHLAVLLQVLMGLLSLLRLDRRLAAFLAMPPVLLFMAVAGFSPSILRAGIMCLIYLLSLTLRRKSDGLTSLGIAVLLMLLANPFTAGDVGFLLSVFATLGMLLAAPNIFDAMCRRLPRRPVLARAVMTVNRVAAQSVAAMLFTLPIVVLVFGQVSLIAPLANIVFYSVSNLILSGGVLGPLLYAVPILRFCAYPVYFVIGQLARFMVWLTELMAKLPLATVTVANDYLSLWLCGAMLLVAGALLLRKNGSLLRLASLLSVVTLLIGMISFSVFDTGVTRITALDTESGVAVVVHRGSRAVVIGCGGERYEGYAVSRFLQANAIRRVDLVLLPTGQEVYTGGAVTALREMEPAMLMLPPDGDGARAVDAMELPGTHRLDAAPAEITLWPGLLLKTDAQGGVRMEIGETSVLIASLRMDLSAQQDAPDLLICSAAVPLSAQAEYAVVCGDPLHSYAAANQLAVRGIRTYTPGGYGAVTALTRGAGDIKFRRERSA